MDNIKLLDNINKDKAWSIVTGLEERKLTKGELKDKERIFKDLKKNKKAFKKRYGKDAEAVMYATATKRAKMSETNDKITEKIKHLSIEMKVSNVSYNPLKSINTLKLTIDFNGNNPNDLGVTFNKTEFDLFANDALLSKFYNEKKIEIIYL